MIAALMLAALSAQRGHWEGVIKHEGRDVLFSIDLTDTPEWNGWFTIPGSDAPALPLGGIEVSAPQVKFAIPEVPGMPAFSGMLAEAGSDIRGTVRQSEGIAVFEMRRTGDARVRAEPLSTPIRRSFVGEWAGTLNAARPVALVVRLREDDAGRAAGTLDSVDSRARNLLLSAIQQEGRTLAFEVRLIGGLFQGEMNADGNRIVGKWTQNERELPLVFERTSK